VQLTFMERWEPFGRVIWMDVPLKRDVSEVLRGDGVGIEVGMTHGFSNR